MTIWNSIIDRVKTALGRNKQEFANGSRTTSFFGNTAKYADTGNRMDKASQEAIQKDISDGRSIDISSPQSSRYQLSKKDREARGLTKQGAMYTSDDMADMQADSKKEVSVASSAVRRIKYDPKTEKLTIKYTSGNKEYDFPDVPPEVVTEFLDSPSKGKYLAHVIRPGYSTALN